MQYFGIPSCPYCKKRVNIIRRWSLKRQGEYKCPRCQGISNIFLSPLTSVFAAIAAVISGGIYFFYKFMLDSIEPKTAIRVLMPFAVFFALSLFMVYLEKPIIKKVKKPMRRRTRAAMGTQPMNKLSMTQNVPKYIAQRGAALRSFRDDEYVPEIEYTAETALNDNKQDLTRTASIDRTMTVQNLEDSFMGPKARPKPRTKSKQVPQVNNMQASSQAAPNINPKSQQYSVPRVNPEIDMKAHAAAAVQNRKQMSNPIEVNKKTERRKIDQTAPIEKREKREMPARTLEKSEKNTVLPRDGAEDMHFKNFKKNRDKKVNDQIYKEPIKKMDTTVIDWEPIKKLDKNDFKSEEIVFKVPEPRRSTDREKYDDTEYIRKRLSEMDTKEGG